MLQLARTARAALPRPSPSLLRPFSSTPTPAAKPTGKKYIDNHGKERRQLVFIERAGSATFKRYLPVTPGRRHLRQPLAEHLHKGEPFRPLTIGKRATGGRNNHGKITVRGRGGGHKRRLRLVDFHRRETGEQEVVRIEYDPGRTAHIALLKHKQTGAMSYILAPAELRAGDTVQSFRSGIPKHFLLDRSEEALISGEVQPEDHGLVDPAEPQSVRPPTGPGGIPKLPAIHEIDVTTLRAQALKPGNCLPVRLIPVGTVVHSISLSNTGPGVMVRSAGTSARIVAPAGPGGKHVQVKLNSGETRYVPLDGVATIGSVSNADYQHTNLGKAGRMRWLGFRPVTRGTAMNAVDHPHGGGRGKSKGGNHPRDKWNNGTKGQRTRPPSSKRGNKLVVHERPAYGQKKRRSRG
ncbi:mitochondrial 54S ribosomal protein rml2 [Rhodotorula toruloides]